MLKRSACGLPRTYLMPTKPCNSNALTNKILNYCGVLQIWKRILYKNGADGDVEVGDPVRTLELKGPGEIRDVLRNPGPEGAHDPRFRPSLGGPVRSTCQWHLSR